MPADHSGRAAGHPLPAELCGGILLTDRESADEIRQYIERFKNCTPEQLLRHMGEARDFFWKYMTPEGRQFFQATRFGEHPQGSNG